MWTLLKVLGVSGIVIAVVSSVGETAIAQSSINSLKGAVQADTSRKAEADGKASQEANQLLQQGIQQFDVSQFEAALQSWQQALMLYRSIKNRQGEGTSLGNLGIAYGALSNYPKAIEYQEQSLAIARELRDLQGEGSSLGNLGNAYYLLDNYPKAIEYHQQSLAIAREIKNRRGESNSLGTLGLAYDALGNYPKAIEYQEQRLTIARDIKHRLGEGAALGNLGIAYSALGNYSKAIEYQEQSLAISREIKDLVGIGTSLNNLGNAYSALGNYPKVIEYQEQSLAIRREVKDRHGEGTSLGNLGNAYYSLGNYPKAIEYQQQSLTTAREIKDRQGEGRSLGNLGLSYASLGNHAKAIEYQKQGIAIARELGDRDLEGQGLNNLGSTLFELNQFTEAESTLRAAISIQESLRVGLIDRNKISIADTQKNAYINLQKVLIAQKKTEAALEIAEKSRARALVELLVSRFSNQSPTDRQNKIQAPNLDAIRRITKTQDATLVQYSLIGSDLLYIWVIKPTGEIIFRSTKLDTKQSLVQLVDNSRKEMGVRGRASIHKVALNTPSVDTTQGNLAKLHQILIDPIAQDLPTDPNQRIIFLPQGPLFLVPFAALPNTQGKHLIDRHTISTAPSIQTLELTQAQAQKPRSKGNAVVVGDPKMPIFNGTPLDPLPGARQETIAIAKLLNTTPLLGEQATKATVLQQMQSARVIHLATHGLLDTVQGEMPGAIALAPDAQDNGLLSAGEIFNLKLNADLVVLSACDTGRGQITGDGVVGLSRSIVAAGVPSVLVSLWAVDDGSTSVLMSEFYRQLQQQSDKAKALRQAMLITRQKYPNSSDWAAFILIGER